MYFKDDIKESAEGLKAYYGDLEGKTIVITGACGFVGVYMCALLDHISSKYLDKQLKILAYDNFISSSVADHLLSNFKSVTFSEYDVVNPLKIEQKVDYIIHAAGIASPVWYRTHPLETLDVSIEGTRNMLSLAQVHGARMLHFSSSEVYGNPDPRHIPTSENYPGLVSCRGPRACYDEGKRVGETLCDIYHSQRGVNVVSVRPFNVYGPGMRENDYRVLPAFAGRLKAGLPLHVYGSGKQTRTFCYITDALIGFLLVLFKGVPGEAYNIGNATPEVSMKELVKLVCEIAGDGASYKLQDYPDGYPSNEPMRRCPDLAKAKLHLDYFPRVSLEEGLRRFLLWANSAYVGDAKDAADEIAGSKSFERS